MDCSQRTARDSTELWCTAGVCERRGGGALRRRRFAERFGPDAALVSPAATGLPGSAKSSRIFFLASLALILNAHLGGLLGGVVCIRGSWAGVNWRRV